MLTPLAITLERAGSRPLAAQLADHLRTAASSGELRAGDRLPSTRQFAAELGVSRTVTAAAYDQLHAEGWLSTKHGSGTFITATPASAPKRVKSLAPQQDGESGLIDLSPGAPLFDGIDPADWARAWRAASSHPAMTRPERPGVDAYRQVVAEHLLRHRGLGPVRAADVLATAGTTAAVLELALSGALGRGTVAIENPGYQRAAGALESAGLKVVGIDVDEQGLIPQAIPRGIGAVYCSPAHQYPLGGRLAAARRMELVRRAREEGFLIIEDDYDGEIRFDVAPLPLLAALAPDVVVHLGTTSKILSMTLGVGWLVAPERVRNAVLRHREYTGTSPSPAGQLILVELAKHGDLGRHLRRIRREIARRRELVTSTLLASGQRLLGDDAGAHVVLALPDARSERELIASGRRAGIKLDGLARHMLPGARIRWHGVAFGYTACTSSELERSLEILAQLLS